MLLPLACFTVMVHAAKKETSLLWITHAAWHMLYYLSSFELCTSHGDAAPERLPRGAAPGRRARHRRRWWPIVLWQVFKRRLAWEKEQREKKKQENAADEAPAKPAGEQPGGEKGGKEGVVEEKKER